MGLERALGTIFYMEGRFPSQDIYLWFSESQDVANETFLSARRYSDLVAALYNKNIEVVGCITCIKDTQWQICKQTSFETAFDGLSFRKRCM